EQLKATQERVAQLEAQLKQAPAAGDLDKARKQGEELRAQLAQGGEQLKAAQERRSEEHTSELQSLTNLVCRLLLEKKNKHIEHVRPKQSTPHLQQTTTCPTAAQDKHDTLHNHAPRARPHPYVPTSDQRRQRHAQLP